MPDGCSWCSKQNYTTCNTLDATCQAYMPRQVRYPAAWGTWHCQQLPPLSPPQSPLRLPHAASTQQSSCATTTMPQKLKKQLQLLSACPELHECMQYCMRLLRQQLVQQLAILQATPHTQPTIHTTPPALQHQQHQASQRITIT